MYKLSLLLFIEFFFSNPQLYSQDNEKTIEFHTLDNSNFKWKEFSFNQPWEKVKTACDLMKIEYYEEEYEQYYIGVISPTNKPYLIQNNIYHEFANIHFNKVILDVKGSANSYFHFNRLYFIKQWENSNDSKYQYTKMLNIFKKKYGNTDTETLTKEWNDTITVETGDSVYKYKRNNTFSTAKINLSDDNPFSIIEQTEWRGSKNICMKLAFMPEENIVILTIEEYPNKSIPHVDKKWFQESEYNEQFTRVFKEFDSKNGYKNLKFGALKSTIKTLVNLKEDDLVKQSIVTTPQYKNWFYTHFDNCFLKFNKKTQLCDVTLWKTDFSDEDYNKLLKELTELFGKPTKLKYYNNDLEITLWEGRKINLFIMRTNKNGIFVDFNSYLLDDTSISDNLY